MDEHIIYVGLDVRKETISLALADGGRRGEAREHGQIAHTPAALTRLLGKLAKPGAVLRLVLRGRAVRLRHPAPAERGGARLRGGGALADPPQAG